MKSVFVFGVLTLLSAVTGSNAFAFPEMIRHGYVNCTTCHVSQTGGGVLTEYGRELSKEVLSAWKSSSDSSKEHLFAYGWVTPPSWLRMGGDVRTIYVFQDDQYASQGRFILMQADLEAAATRGKFTALASLGYQNPKNSLTLQDHLISRRHYLSYQLTDNYSVRGGRFLPAFGINTPDHISATRQPLGFGQGLESYNLEGSYIGDKTNIFITGILGRPDAMALDREKGAAVQGAYAIYDKTKLGLSSFYGKNRRGTRTLVGPYGLISFSDNLVLLTELDFQFRSPVGQESIAGAVNSQKLSYELRQGFWGFVTQDWSRQDFKNERTTAQAYGVGLQVFPRPHFEFNLSWQRQKLKAFSEEFFDYAWLMSHFYF